MGQKVNGYSEALHAKALLDQAVLLLDFAGLGQISAQADEVRESLADWLAMSLVDFVQSPTFNDAGRHTVLLALVADPHTTDRV